MQDQTRIELEAAAFRTLVAHFRKRTDVQNLDLMNLSGLCRSCLSKWCRPAAEGRRLEEGVGGVLGVAFSSGVPDRERPHERQNLSP